MVIKARGEEREVSLRRADWRFLLPTRAGGAFGHMVLLGGPEGLDKVILDTHISETVSRAATGAGSADALIMLAGARVDRRKAMQCLRPGGVLYCEIDRRSFRTWRETPAKLERSLRNDGFSPQGVYWPVPTFDNCRRLLPLDVRAVVPWYINTLFVASSLRLRLVELILRACNSWWPLNLRRIVPLYSIVAVAPGGTFDLPPLLSHPGLPLRMRTSDLRPVFLTTGVDEASRLVVLPFPRDANEPTGVLKVARREEFNLNTEREQETLKALRQHASAKVRASVPRPSGIVHYGAFSASAESYAPGRVLTASTGRWGAPLRTRIDDLSLAASWLTDFHRHTEHLPPSCGELSLIHSVERALESYQQLFGILPGEQLLFGAMRARLESLADITLPFVWMHNDFGPWNMYRDGERLTVIDWEFGRDREQDRYGPPVCDMVYFATHWTHIAQQVSGRSAELRSFCNLFFGAEMRSRIEAAAWRAILSYLETLQIGHDVFPVLLSYTWIERANDFSARQHSLGRAGVNTRMANQYVAYINVLCNHVERLFAAHMLAL